MAAEHSDIQRTSMQKWRSIVLFLICLISGIGVIIFIVLEMTIPVQNSSTIAPPSTTMNASRYIVKSHSFPEYMLQHRKGYLRNSHVQMMGKVQKRLNVSDCWLCAHFPQTADKSLMTYAEPLPLNTTCFAFFMALFDDPKRREITRVNSKKFDEQVLSLLNCSVGHPSLSMPASRLLINNLATLPYHDFVQMYVTPAIDPKVDCPSSVLHGKECPVPIHTHLVKEPELCLSRKGVTFMGKVDYCPITIDVSTVSPLILSVGRSVYFVCGDHAYLWLPADWSGVCYLALLLPDILPVHTYDLPLLRQHTQHVILKRAVIAGDFVKGLFPMYGIIANSVAIQALGTLFEETINATATALTAISLEMRAIRLVALQNRMGLDLLFMKEGGLCEIVGVSCCSFIPDEGGTVADSIQKLNRIEMKVHKIAEGSDSSLGSWFSGIWSAWGWKILIGLFGLLAIFVFFCLCLHCLPQICAQCARSVSTPSTTHIMLTRMDIDPDLESSYLVHVPGYGPLARAQYDRPMLYVRHLYNASVYEPPSELCEHISRSQFPR